jgi:alpha-2-macroglobulin-like protein
MKRRIALICVSVLLGGCVDGTSSLNADEPVTGNKEVRPSAGVDVDEFNIRGHVSGETLTVSIPVLATSKGSLAGTLGVAITDLNGAVVAASTRSFALGESGAVDVELPASALGKAGADEITKLVKYDLIVGKSRTIGYRSLFHAMEKLDLQARIPGELQEGGATQIRVFAVDPLTKTPRANLDVKIALENAETNTVETYEAVTGTDGSAVIELPAQSAGLYKATATAGQGAATFALLEQDIQVRRDSRVLVTTDKPVYQPGQTMYIRALALKKPLLDAEAGTQAVIEVYDGKGNMVFRRYEKTNDFGIVSTPFKIANQVNVGTYKVAVKVGETTTEKSLEVKPYQLPKFKLDTDLGHSFFLVGDTVDGQIDARYFFGKPVEGQVEVRAFAMGVGVEEIGFAGGATDANGTFTFSLDLPSYMVGQPIEGGNGIVTFEVKVTDSAGNEVTKSKSVVIAQDPIQIVAIPESGQLVKGLDNNVLVFATDPMGQPIAAAMSITEKGATVPNEILGEGIVKLTLRPNDTTQLKVIASTPNDTVTADLSLNLDAHNGGLLVRTDKALYTVGESATVQAFLSGQSGKVFFDIIKDGQTVLTKSVSVNDGEASLALDLDGSLVGDVLVEAYRVQEDASIVRDKRLIFVRDANNLDINIKADKGQYLPGEEATLTFEVKDRMGEPQVAALGVQIVDEAVYAISENKPGLLETYFLIQEALQTPNYQVKGAAFDISSIVTQAPDEPEVQTVAGAAFSALDVNAAASEISSWGAVQNAIPGLLSEHHNANLDIMRAFFLKLETHDALDEDNVEAKVEGQTVFYDAWGNLYTFEIRDRWDRWEADITSRGPDELEGTMDDLKAKIRVLNKDIDGDMFLESADSANEAPANDDGGMSEPMPGNAGGGNGTEGPKVRKDFPETLYYNPSLITDPSGKASVTLDMADSITEWRISTLANTADGVVGSTTGAVTVFQDFFVDVSFPATVSRHDEITFPVAIYNYLPEPQTVEISLKSADWFTAQGSLTQTLDLEPNQVTSISFPVKVDKVGKHALTVTGMGSTMSDAVQRVVHVKPNGTRVDSTHSGMLEGTVSHAVDFPADMVPDSQNLLVKIYPGIMAQAVEGLDSMLREPHGCFEQTTSSNWPNTLILDYMNITGQTNPEIELKATGYLNQGYQRLLTFECTGGGFVWFGDPAPANVILSAMGVLEFADMSRVMEIDQDVIKRTADWVIADQKDDGHWTTNQGSEFATVHYDDAKTTAFVTWALAESPYGDEAVSKAVSFLEPIAKAADTDVYTLAMTANAFAADDPNASRTQALLKRLSELAEVDDKGLVSWTYKGSSQNYFGNNGGGVSPTTIEVTALTVQAMVAANSYSDQVGGALAFLAGQKDGLGNYGSTHATILTLRAMIRASSNKTEEGEGTVTVKLDNEVVKTLEVTEENRNVFHQFELVDLVDPSKVSDLEISYAGTGKLMYQALWNHYEELPEVAVPGELLSIKISYDKTNLEVNDVVTATVTVKNLTDGQLDMPMLDLGVPPGFKVLGDKLKDAVSSQKILKYEVPGQQISVYLEKLSPGEVFTLSWDLQALYPVKAKTPPSSVYLYYDKESRADIAGQNIQVGN